MFAEYLQEIETICQFGGIGLQRFLPIFQNLFHYVCN